MNESWTRVNSLFAEAIERPASQRLSFLISQCSNLQLVREVHRLTQLDAMAGSFLSAPIDFSAPQELSELEEGQIVARRFRIESLIGRGGMSGGVYKAFDLDLEIYVALKVIEDSREFIAARCITHANVCRVFDCGRDDSGLRFLTMELLEGETLAERLFSRGPLRGAEMNDLILQLCAGLAAAHEAGILHRDLKPANVFLTTSGRIVLTDFGLAKVAEKCTNSRQFIGTLPYMAPELFAGRTASTSSDLFSLGVVLFEACTGKLPFENCQIPWKWRRLILGCLNVNPAKRQLLFESKIRYRVVPYCLSTICQSCLMTANLSLWSSFVGFFANIFGKTM